MLSASLTFSVIPHFDLDTLSSYYTVDIWGCLKSYGDYDKLFLRDNVWHETRKDATEYGEELLRKFDREGNFVG